MCPKPHELRAKLQDALKARLDKCFHYLKYLRLFAVRGHTLKPEEKIHLGNVFHPSQDVEGRKLAVGLRAESFPTCAKEKKSSLCSACFANPVRIVDTHLCCSAHL